MFGKEGYNVSIVQIGVLGIVGTLVAAQFKSGKSEYGIYISVGLSLIIFLYYQQVKYNSGCNKADRAIH